MARFIQFIKNKLPLHILNITGSSSGGVTQTTLDILQACYVSWLETPVRLQSW
jgi:hypothetical protein